MESLYQILLQLKIPPSLAEPTSFLALSLALLLLAFLSDRLAKKLLEKVLLPIIKRTRNQWDDMALRHGLFKRLAHYAPATLIYLSAPLFESSSLIWTQTAKASLQRLAVLYMIFVTVRVADAFVNAVVDIYGSLKKKKKKPIK
ncbi:MAG: hypothetical protein KDK66_00975, partial [Deltaproteobacteria bacterium]|nr:hypothetical protein [Deltaproteobacteria bacterium]